MLALVLALVLVLVLVLELEQAEWSQLRQHAQPRHPLQGTGLVDYQRLEHHHKAVW